MCCLIFQARFVSIYILKGKNKSFHNERSEIIFLACKHGDRFPVNDIYRKDHAWFLNAHMPTYVSR